MSFRTRLTGFFLLIVVVPMIAVGFLVFRLISDSERGKADARANGLATAAASLYMSSSASARADAEALARQATGHNRTALAAHLTALAAKSGLARIRLRIGSRTLADTGDRTAIAPGFAAVTGAPKSKAISVAVSELTAAQYVRDLAGNDTAVVVREGGRTLAGSVAQPQGVSLPRSGTVTLGGTQYREVTQAFVGFGNTRVQVTVLSDLSATATSVQTSQVLAAVFIAGFLLLAFAFSVLASRALEGQLARFLEAARRLGSGDFSSRVPTEGRDDFAALGEEFNSMSSQLEGRLEELRQERARLREAIHRIGQTFASNLDRPALLQLALKTAIDAVQASGGRLSVRDDADGTLEQVEIVGQLAGLEAAVYEAERFALAGSALGESSQEGVYIAAAALGPTTPGRRPQGLITVVRPERPFGEDDRDVLQSLASQATLALENVELHYQVQRQAITDELTGLANHGRFQELLSREIEQVRRYPQWLGLIMLDIDDFKAINDTHGHPQGDVVLKRVSEVLRQNSREPDTAARYGGEEMALILPHTNLEGSYAIAERVRLAIELMQVRLPESGETLRITASLGVAATSDADKDALIAAADGALYTAKREGKNRTVRAPAGAANVVGGE